MPGARQNSGTQLPAWNVLVTDGEQRATLAVVRALGKAGMRVSVAEAARSSLAGASRYCAESLTYPDAANCEAEFKSFLGEALSSGRYQLVLPMTDLTVRLLAEHVEQTGLPAGVCVPIPNRQQVETVQDKGEMLRLAQEVGIGGPATYMLSDAEEARELARRLRYPVIIKPRFSRYLHGGRWIKGTTCFAYDAAELVRLYEHWHARIPFPLVQERVQGKGIGVFLLMWDGMLKAAFCHRRLREKPAWGGVSVYSESAALDVPLVEKSLALLKRIGWRGPAMVEFKVDDGDGEPKFMEVNGRFWGSLQLAIDAGMNFPLLLARLAAGEELGPHFSYRVGVRSRWLWGDWAHLVSRLAGRARDLAMAPPVSRGEACGNFLRLYERNMQYEDLRLGDLKPFFQQFRRPANKLLARLRGVSQPAALASASKQGASA